MSKPTSEKPWATPEGIGVLLLFSLSSSMLLLLNKVCLHLLPAPSLLSTLQFSVSALVVLLLKFSGLATVDDFEWAKVKPYLLYTLLFCACIYCNMRALQGSNVETVICFRTCVPLLVCVLDVAFLGRELPGPRACVSLLALVVGTVGYISSDRALQLYGWGAYAWAAAYAGSLAIEAAYGKHIVGGHLNFKSMWGPTLYSNLFAIAPMGAWAVLMGEPAALAALPREAWGRAALCWGGSCVLGLAISFTGWKVPRPRRRLSPVLLHLPSLFPPEGEGAAHRDVRVRLRRRKQDGHGARPREHSIA